MQAGKPAPPPDLPANPGVYYRRGDAAWIKLEPAAVVDSRMSGLDQFIYTDGMTDVTTSVVYGGAQARVQISDPRPVLYIRGAGSSADAMIVHLTRRKDRRTTQISHSAASVDNKGGFKRGEIRKAAVLLYSDDSFSLTPEEELKPGEYLIAFGYPDKAYDFGIAQYKK